MAAIEAKLPDSMQDEIWRIMQLVADLETDPENTLCISQLQPSQRWSGNNHTHHKKLLLHSPRSLNSKRYQYECQGDEELDDGFEEVDGVEVDSPIEHDENDAELKDAAEKLRKAADAYDEQEKLVKDILNYIRSKDIEISSLCGSNPIQNLRPSDLLFQSGVMSSVYGFFRSKLLSIVGDGEDFTKIALVSSVTQGVTRGLKESSGYVHLSASLSSKFISDRYGSFIMQKGGMAKLVLDSQEVPPVVHSEELD